MTRSRLLVRRCLVSTQDESPLLLRLAAAVGVVVAVTVVAVVVVAFLVVVAFVVVVVFVVVCVGEGVVVVVVVVVVVASRFSRHEVNFDHQTRKPCTSSYTPASNFASKTPF